LKKLWNKLENLLAFYSPALCAALKPPATEAEIRTAEQALQIKFPKILRDSFLIHNGTGREGPYLLEGFALLSLDEIVSEWKINQGAYEDQDNQEVDPEVQAKWWHSAWIPLSYDGAGNHHCLDLAPSAEGSSGQILSFWHDAPERRVLAKNFKEFIAGFVKALQIGLYTYSETEGQLLPVQPDRSFTDLIPRPKPKTESELNLPEVILPALEPHPFLKKLKTKACTQFKPSRGSSLSETCRLAYWLYIFRQEQAALEICEFLSQIPFDGRFVGPYAAIQDSLALQARLYRAQNWREEAEKGHERLVKGGVVDTRLHGSLLKLDWIADYHQRNLRTKEEFYRAVALSELVFMAEMGGSECCWPIAKIEAEIQTQLAALRTLHQLPV